MSESSSVNNNDFKFEIRRIRQNKEDYKDNKIEKFLFEYLSKDSSFFSKLDKEDGTQGTITRGDINIFLSSKEAQKKKITEEDVINFLNKVRDLNPTEKEKAYSQMNFVDENKHKVITEDMYSSFDKESVYTSDLQKTILDENGSVKKGFEIFDLNGDNKFDDIEVEYYINNSSGYKGYDNLKSFLSSLDKLGSADGKADGVITAEDKQKAYDSIVTERNKKLYERLKELNIKGSLNKEIVTPEILALFENGVSEVSLDELFDSNGRLKQGFEIFDMNNDSKIDDKEKSFFYSGGHPISKGSSKLTLENLVNSLEMLDKFGYDKRYRGNMADKNITLSDKAGLYMMLDASQYMLDTIKEFPKDIRQSYEEALTELYLGNYDSVAAIGAYNNKETVAVNYSLTNKDELAAVLLHETTHYILTKKNNMKSALLQEVETFFMEYRLHKLAKNNPDYMKGQAIKHDSIFANTVVNHKYINYIDQLKRENPDITDKELAVEAFIKYHYDSYDKNYNEGVSQDQLRELVKNADNFVMLK